MNISAIPKISFKSNTPVYHVYNREKDFSVRELTHEEIKGPILALIRRLNNKEKEEHKFLKRYIPDFASFPLATSTEVGNDFVRKSTIIYGQDALNVNELREDAYVHEIYSKDDINEAIRKNFIMPMHKQVINKITGKPIGLILYTKSQGDSFTLTNVYLTDKNNNVIAQMQDDTAETEALRRKEEEENNILYQEYLEEQEALNQSQQQTKTSNPHKLIQGDLFEGTA